MPRYVKEFQINASPDIIFSEISQYLTNIEGYEYTLYENENVFKKGHGVVAAPSFIKISFYDNCCRIEAWIKFAVLPGVYAGEMDLTGVTGIAVKKPLEARVINVESIIRKYGFEKPSQVFFNAPQQPAPNGMYVQQPPMQQVQYRQPPVQNYPPQQYATPANNAPAFCPRCGTASDSSSAFCGACGQKLK